VSRVTPPELELWFTGYLRTLAAAEDLDLDVDNKEPPELSLPLRKPLIVIRDDSGSRLSHVTFDRSIGATVLGGSKLFAKPAMDIARWLSGVLNDEAIALVPGSPIASVDWDGANGPYAVPEALDVARVYQTAQYVVSGSW
jgi:hypothetical protein